MIDIEDRLTLDERSTVDFVLGLRKRWSDAVYPTLAAEYAETGATAETPEQVEPVMHQLPSYPWFSHLERVQQKMLWRTAGDAVVRRRQELVGDLDAAPEQGVGSITLDHDLELPEWYTDYDIHVQPGSFFSDDLSAYVYEFGARIVMLRDNDGYKFHSLFAQTTLPEKPEATRIVDIGCGFGKSTRPLVAKYPGAEVIGVDLAAPGLRLAHAEAEDLGLPISYVQAEGSRTGLESGSCDVVTGTMVLHEMPSDAIVAVLQEGARLLKPGGEMHFLEFMLTGDPFRDATVIEHADRNNEPYFRDLFGTDTVAACEAAGLVDVSWSPFDERRLGLQPDGWGDRAEWHFPWAVLSARKAI
ncbi:class I SAM-dependent methyltransferase [Nocardioides marmotae]|uniref:Methyltransferase domain-containing protein n=1 Tax=Nocardioides marmotae TaxID=2663857 RepID=A0A6I3J4S7_9ACTN|nr:class I SAM-dependent methyltransferase [Nocardioides marmotae]MCR6030496.1 methyltransferase domain-containing protein [Gordonia jinghuaiqii]MBC9734627.1 class I SAM-dependent methyltransferase [Nocardioides marmotae]MTB85729.1 methyltransferase domain-containing protein [Nocardioides marmotae]MTB94132.1 methyltransferase domain-containing protein [Nocardioides marmotae]QKE00428.1 class I SAM-dependent methyltransferase [Nocardioides marmotae]